MEERPSRILRSRIESRKLSRVAPEEPVDHRTLRTIACEKNRQCELESVEVIDIGDDDPPEVSSRWKRAAAPLRASLRLQQLRCSAEQNNNLQLRKHQFKSQRKLSKLNVAKWNAIGSMNANNSHHPSKARKSKNTLEQLSTETSTSSDCEVADPNHGDIACEKESLISDASKVKNTIRQFNAYFLQVVQEEETRRRKDRQKKSAFKRVLRPDLLAVTKMKEKNAILFEDKRLGHLPGINVGDHFFSRAEMVVVGLHKRWLNGIDFIGGSKQIKGFKLLPLAVSIVLSGVYEDDVDNSEDIIYTGEGGNNFNGDRRQIADQKMTRGNLALKNSIEQGNFVRVIRGHRSSNSYSGKVYTYDGLYKVISYWAEKGISGHTIYKYKLKRARRQSVLTSNQVHYFGGEKPNSTRELRGLVCKDMSNGLERLPIPVTNVVDKSPTPCDTAFKYLTYVKIPKFIQKPDPAVGCSCDGECVDPNKCSCAHLNGNSFPYVGSDGGRLLEAKDIIFECGPQCSCAPSCLNRATQRGLQYRLEVFRTPNKGWGVRSWDFIPSGAFVCEYTGKVVLSDELDAIDDTYVFALDCMLTMRGIGGRERRWGGISKPIREHLGLTFGKKKEHVGQAEYSIDAGKCGNVSRFINHSCDPNLFVQCVLSSHHDVKLARIVLFAGDDIPPLQELSYDYGYILNSVVGDDGAVKKRPCYCGAVICRKRLY